MAITARCASNHIAIRVVNCRRIRSTCIAWDKADARVQTLTPPAVTHTPTSQAGSLSARIAELLRPAAFPHPAPDPRVIETHISWVILAGAFVYKIRKPVNFGFLDFSMLEQRRADCEAEVRLNRRLCPDLYLGVVLLSLVITRIGDLAEVHAGIVEQLFAAEIGRAHV